MYFQGRSGSAMVLSKFSVLGPLPNLDNSRAWDLVAAGAGGGCLDIFLSSIFSFFFLPLWNTALYLLKYCLKRPLTPKQST